MGKILIVIVAVVIVVIAGVFAWPKFFGQWPIGCTQEAKLCSDGSYVGRVGPSCEFALCPKEDLIRVFSPRANEKVSSPLLISGEARGYWFFEASFPVVLVDWDGRIIAQHYAQAKGDPATGEINWMTENFVPFEAVLEFEKPEFIGDFSKRGALILQKDNPSGLPEHDDALEVPIIFKQ
ncbi:MAG: Gmad2 immunoglobulin-like domain-containing protein [Patescibacteria group bacterium]